MSKKLTADQIALVQDAYRLAFDKFNSGELQAKDWYICEMADLGVIAGKTGNSMLAQMLGQQMGATDPEICTIIRDVALVAHQSGKSADQVLHAAGCVGGGITEMYRSRTIAA